MRNIQKAILSFAFALAGLSQTQAQSTVTVVNKTNGTEEVIEIPENMTADVDNLLAEWFSKTYLDKDEECQMKDENPVFETEVYINRLHRMRTVIEMPYNEVVRKFIDSYLLKRSRQIASLKRLGEYYFPIFENSLTHTADACATLLPTCWLHPTFTCQSLKRPWKLAAYL